jgi:gluconokinase
MSAATALRLVVMGVSGCGKSTFSVAIADALGLVVVDGDDLHSPESVAKMQSGIALDDADRWPWLDRIASCLRVGLDDEKFGASAKGRVVACSALKRAYRDRIRRNLPTVKFIFLDGDSELIRKRLSLRTNHFMQPGLLQSQLSTLERPGADERDVITLNIARSIDELVLEASAALRHTDLNSVKTS